MAHITRHEPIPHLPSPLTHPQTPLTQCYCSRRYCQHSREQLPLNASPLAFMQQTFPELYSVDEWRKTLGMFGVSGDRQTRPMRDMSNGLQTRVVLMAVALRRPHVLLLDEPTNHMDMQSVDALAQAINEFSGGLLLVSHDFHLIGQVRGVGGPAGPRATQIKCISPQYHARVAKWGKRGGRIFACRGGKGSIEPENWGARKKGSIFR